MVTSNTKWKMFSRTMRVSVVLLTLNLTVSAQAQISPEWYRIHGGQFKDYGNSIIMTTDGGLAITGVTKSYEGPEGDLLLLKTDALGYLEWSTTLGGGALNKGKEILQTADGGYVIAGYSIFYDTDSSARQALVMKTDATGVEIWAHLYGGTGIDTSFDIVPVQGGGFFVTGDYQLEGGLRNTYLILLDEDGNTIWEQIIGGELVDERTFTGCQLTNGNLVFGGNIHHRNVSSIPPDFHIGCVDIQGNIVWEHEFGGDGVDIVRRMRALPTGGFVLIGETELLPATPDSHNEMYVSMFTEDGDSVWTTLIGTIGDEECYGLEITSDGDLITAGSTKGGYGNSWDLYVTKVDTFGNTAYTWSYQTPNLEFGKGIVEQAPGEYVLTGKTTYMTDNYGSTLLLKLVETVTAYENFDPQTQSMESTITGYSLHPVIPNPTNADAIVSLTLPETGYINAVVYNVMGREVALLQNGTLTAGTHQFALMGSNLASGIHFIRAVVPGQMDQVQRITIVR